MNEGPERREHMSWCTKRLGDGQPKQNIQHTHMILRISFFFVLLVAITRTTMTIYIWEVGDWEIAGETEGGGQLCGLVFCFFFRCVCMCVCM